MAVNVIKYEWDIGEDPNLVKKACEIVNLNFHIWLGKHKNNRHVTIDLFKCYEKEETQLIVEELDLKQLVCLRDFLNSIPFLDEEEE